MDLPFAVVRGVPLFVGLSGDQLVGLTVPGGDEVEFEPGDVEAVVSADPAAVYWGVGAHWAQQDQRRAAEGRVRRLTPRGKRFDPAALPSSGFTAVRSTILRHRAEVPSVETVMFSSLFAVSTVRTSIEQAEKSFNCFVELYERGGRTLPDVADIRGCFRGLQNSKSRMFSEVAAYAPVIRDAVSSGLRDRDLRRTLVRETDLPTGLGVSKTSFTLALLGQDCVCLDARLMVRMFGSRDEATRVEKGWEKTGRRVSELALKRYESVEDAFLSGNPFYKPRDPVGRARAQWMSWESVGGAPATHSVWLDVVS